MNCKNGFSLIELIMTIVVLGIAFVGAPLIMHSTAQSAKWLNVSRGVYHGISKVEIIRSKFWDQRNIDDLKDFGVSVVLTTTEDTSGNGFLCGNEHNRSGHYPGDGRRKCGDRNATKANESGIWENNSSDVNASNDIDDYGKDEDKGKDGVFDLMTTVKYVKYRDIEADKHTFSIPKNTPNIGVGATSNIKEIIVELKDIDGNRVGEYRYYATNIGAPIPFVKSNN